MRGAENRKDVTNGWPGAEVPGPAELAGTLGGAQDARRIVGAQLAAASSRRIPGRGTPVLTARTGAPLEEGRRRDRPAVRARSPRTAAIPPTTSAGVDVAMLCGPAAAAGDPATPASASCSAPQPPPSAAPRNVLPAGDLFRPAAAAAVAAAAPSARPRGQGSDCGDRGEGSRCHRRRCRSCS